MYAITIRMKAKPGRGDELVRLSQKTIAPSRAEEHCLFFDLLRGESDRDEIVFYEAYRDRAAFEAHLKTDHVRVWQAEALPIVAPESIRMPAHTSVAVLE